MALVSPFATPSVRFQDPIQGPSTMSVLKVHKVDSNMEVK